MKPVLKQKEAVFFVTTAEFITFITQNSDMEWNACCDFLESSGICVDGNALYEKEEILAKGADYNTKQIKWVGGFFKAHPWIERMRIVFDD
jgi:hypothetical protein